MAKLSQKINEYRTSGARWILNYARENGIYKAEKELERRHARFIPFEIPDSIYKQLEDEVIRDASKKVLIMLFAMFKEKRGYGQKRLTDLMNDFNDFVEPFFEKQSDGTTYVSIADYEQLFLEEYGFTFDIELNEKRGGNNEKN